jgi:hypothetical protein
MWVFALRARCRIRRHRTRRRLTTTADDWVQRRQASVSSDRRIADSKRSSVQKFQRSPPEFLETTQVLLRITVTVHLTVAPPNAPFIDFPIECTVTVIYHHLVVYLTE